MECGLCRSFWLHEEHESFQGFLVGQENRNHSLIFLAQKNMGPGGSKKYGSQQDATKLQGLWCSWKGGGKMLKTWPAQGQVTVAFTGSELLAPLTIEAEIHL